MATLSPVLPGSPRKIHVRVVHTRTDFTERALRGVLMALHTVVAITALYGGGMLLLNTSGEYLQLPLSMLKGAPFRDYLVPGVLLFLVVGGGNLVASFWLVGGWRWGPAASVVAGAFLTGWMVTQILMLGYQAPIQGVFLALGVVTLALALARAWRRGLEG
ncbi:MAG: hypothetical protein AB2A00_29855 [Myxococcota bacterium]